MASAPGKFPVLAAADLYAPAVVTTSPARDTQSLMLWLESIRTVFNLTLRENKASYRILLFSTPGFWSAATVRTKITGEKLWETTQIFPSFFP